MTIANVKYSPSRFSESAQVLPTGCGIFPSYSKATRPEGLEPSTYGLEIRCSIRLSYGRRIRTDIYRVSRRIKATGATRLLLLLFRDKNTVSLSQKCPSTTVNNSGETPIYYGAGSRIRTDDLLITNQLKHRPDEFFPS